MGKRDKEDVREDVETKEEMSLEQARAYRASLAPKTEKVLSDSDKREAFRIYWAQAKAAFGKGRDLEEILWLHLKSMKMDKPEQFEQGLAHFGLKKIK